MAKKLYTAIVFMADPVENTRKYRNISNINSFYNFCVKINAAYFNTYDKSTKLFVERIYIKKGV
jgi:HD superfamily phosphohydrolase YqeK